MDASTAIQSLPAPEVGAGPVACIIGQPSGAAVAAVYSNGLVLLWDISMTVRPVTCTLKNNATAQLDVIMRLQGSPADPKLISCGKQVGGAGSSKQFYTWAAWSDDGKSLVVSGPAGSSSNDFYGIAVH